MLCLRIQWAWEIARLVKYWHVSVSVGTSELSPLNPCEKPGAEVCKRQLSGRRDWGRPGLTGCQSHLVMGSRLVREINKVDPVS